MRKNLSVVNALVLICAAQLVWAAPVFAAKKKKKHATTAEASAHPCSVLLKTGQLKQKFSQDRKIASKTTKQEYYAAVQTVENYIKNNGNIENIRGVARYVQYAMRKKVSHVKVMVFLATEINKGTELAILENECVIGDPVAYKLLRSVASHKD